MEQQALYEYLDQRGPGALKHDTCHSLPSSTEGAVSNLHSYVIKLLFVITNRNWCYLPGIWQNYQS